MSFFFRLGRNRCVNLSRNILQKKVSTEVGGCFYVVRQKRQLDARVVAPFLTPARIDWSLSWAQRRLGYGFGCHRGTTCRRALSPEFDALKALKGSERCAGPAHG